MFSKAVINRRLAALQTVMMHRITAQGVERSMAAHSRAGREQRKEP